MYQKCQTVIEESNNFYLYLRERTGCSNRWMALTNIGKYSIYRLGQKSWYFWRKNNPHCSRELLVRPSNHRYLNGPGQTVPKAVGTFSVLFIFLETNWTKSFSILHIFLAGLGIHSLFFCANCSFFESKRAKVWFTLFKVQIALDALFNEQLVQMLFFTAIHSFVLGTKRQGWACILFKRTQRSCVLLRSL